MLAFNTDENTQQERIQSEIQQRSKQSVIIHSMEQTVL